MPTYSYFCPHCKEFEETHSITTQLDECPKCKKDERIQYHCKICDTSWFYDPKIKDQVLVQICKNCHADEKNVEHFTPKVKRLISAGSSFILVGNGWARDNYGK